jgi:ribosomal protein S20
MIIPSQIDREMEAEMKEMGSKLTAQDIYNPEAPSINDAVIQFNGGCTGEIVSPQGLIFTNHHCGYGAIQAHSTFEHNYVKEGFWAKKLKDELPNPGMYVTFVRKIEDVTDRVLNGVSEDMDESIKKNIINKNINSLVKTLPKKDWQEIQIKPFYDGNKYFAFTIENYKDIRLVGAPPASIGKFGADTDNWMWPRHTGDFSIFRIYADKNNRPAEYSPDNVPYQTDSYFKISLKGANPGDFFMVYGFPGRTQEYLPSIAVEQKVNIINPARIEIREKALNEMDRFMQKNDTIKLQYTAKYARIANYWKKWIGETQGIKKSDAIKKKKDFEKRFLNEAKAQGLDDSYQNIFNEFDNLYKQITAPELARNYFIETFYLNNDLLKRALLLYRLENTYETNGKEAYKNASKKTSSQINSTFKNYNPQVDKEVFKSLMKLYQEKMPQKYLNEQLKNKNLDEFAENVYQNSILNDQEKLEKLLLKNPRKFIKTIDNDEAYIFAKELINDYFDKIAPDYNALRGKINNLQKKYVTGIIKTSNKLPDPDANGTLRISYGIIKGYEPRDAVYYFPISHLKGVMEKYIPGDYEFDVPKKLIELYKKKDYAPYSTTGKMPVNFLGTAHTTGGNSGSPAINKEGELIGINFDRVWEGTMSDLYYDKEISRNIMVDIRYILFIIDKFAHTQHIINELQIQK